MGLALVKEGETVTSRLTDSGIGISKVNLGRMFERFYQAEDHLTRTKGGLGLGLTIAKWIIDAHGGKI